MSLTSLEKMTLDPRRRSSKKRMAVICDGIVLPRPTRPLDLLSILAEPSQIVEHVPADVPFFGDANIPGLWGTFPAGSLIQDPTDVLFMSNVVEQASADAQWVLSPLRPLSPPLGHAYTSERTLVGEEKGPGHASDAVTCQVSNCAPQSSGGYSETVRGGLTHGCVSGWLPRLENLNTIPPPINMEHAPAFWTGGDLFPMEHMEALAHHSFLMGCRVFVLTDMTTAGLPDIARGALFAGSDCRIFPVSHRVFDIVNACARQVYSADTTTPYPSFVRIVKRDSDSPARRIPMPQYPNNTCQWPQRLEIFVPRHRESQVLAEYLGSYTLETDFADTGESLTLAEWATCVDKVRTTLVPIDPGCGPYGVEYFFGLEESCELTYVRRIPLVQMRFEGYNLEMVLSMHAWLRLAIDKT
ncbi:hypothetical protein FA95DRAFT_1607947 [Auriscalpium vulgare]|uniref:Uncharacterized protein n=1 Tax=Auriscalpium vulgare TaxID=40419 RepID=A0ACB8RME5_9AGAM|nr:hypothetical protein FA95DRAFT_1607947 [Auriscalpium vulgare]